MDGGAARWESRPGDAARARVAPSTGSTRGWRTVVDAERFDRIARGLATATSRRRAAAALLGGVMLLARRAAPAGAAPGDPGDPAHCCRQTRQNGSQFAEGTACCPSGQVCYSCAAIRSRTRDGSTIYRTASDSGCCTRGVDCPEDVHGHHSQHCQSFVGGHP